MDFPMCIDFIEVFKNRKTMSQLFSVLRTFLCASISFRYLKYDLQNKFCMICVFLKHISFKHKKTVTRLSNGL